MHVDPTKRRRRGASLQGAVLDAAWAEITDRGYAAFTVDAVAARAETSKAVLYRRWPGKAELAQAAIEHVLAQDPVAVPDTGTLRGDVVALLRAINERRVGIAVHFIASLGEFYRETGTSLASLRESVAEGQASALNQIVDRAVARGEISAEPLSERVIRLPVDLMRHELLIGSAPARDADIIEIVDTIFLPLVDAASGAGSHAGRG